LICRASANMRTVTVWSSLIMSLMRTTLSSFRELEGRPDLVSSSTDTLPKTNRHWQGTRGFRRVLPPSGGRAT
jgi:hypothetical protein